MDQENNTNSECADSFSGAPVSTEFVTPQLENPGVVLSFVHLDTGEFVVHRDKKESMDKMTTHEVCLVPSAHPAKLLGKSYTANQLRYSTPVPT